VAADCRRAGRGISAHLNEVPGISLRQLFLYDPNGIKIEINIPPT